MGANPGAGIKRVGELSLMDLASIDLVLRGGSVVDWQRVHFESNEEIQGFLRAQELDLARQADRVRIEAIKQAAIEYLRRQFRFPIPRPIERAPVEELLLVASGKGHRQLCACTVLKAMHIIHHVDARELRFSLPISEQEMLRLVEERVYRLVGHMLAVGLPIMEFVGGRKRRDAIYTKLLSKPDAHATAIYDKLRFRLVTRDRSSILPVLQYLLTHLFPFNYVVPGESTNTIFQLRSFCEADPDLRDRTPRLSLGDELSGSPNQFSSEHFRIVHFVVDVPVRVPDEMLAAAPGPVRTLGQVVFALCEFQLVDRKTEEANEASEASHASYKERQKQAVTRRLKLGRPTAADVDQVRGQRRKDGD
ncbi:MAG: TIGR04552 family protein [Deltaproteobacteria bacterium]|nr:TIGR04552 family protein [Deltaproteobacteria bacterium]